MRGQEGDDVRDLVPSALPLERVIPAIHSAISSGIFALISLGMMPGATALTVIVREPTSWARQRVSAIRPAFEAA